MGSCSLKENDIPYCDVTPSSCQDPCVDALAPPVLSKIACSGRPVNEGVTLGVADPDPLKDPVFVAVWLQLILLEGDTLDDEEGVKLDVKERVLESVSSVDELWLVDWVPLDGADNWVTLEELL